MWQIKCLILVCWAKQIFLAMKLFNTTSGKKDVLLASTTYILEPILTYSIYHTWQYLMSLRHISFLSIQQRSCQVLCHFLPSALYVQESTSPNRALFFFFSDLPQPWPATLVLWREERLHTNASNPKTSVTSVLGHVLPCLGIGWSQVWGREDGTFSTISWLRQSHFLALQQTGLEVSQVSTLFPNAKRGGCQEPAVVPAGRRAAWV